MMEAPQTPRSTIFPFAFQERSAYPWLSVEDNIQFGMKIKKERPDVIRGRTEEILDLMGLKKFRKSYPHQLSVSGEQRIVIGRSFAMRPDLLLMDEP